MSFLFLIPGHGHVTSLLNINNNNANVTTSLIGHALINGISLNLCSSGPTALQHRRRGGTRWFLQSQNLEPSVLPGELGTALTAADEAFKWRSLHPELEWAETWEWTCKELTCAELTCGSPSATQFRLYNHLDKIQICSKRRCNIIQNDNKITNFYTFYYYLLHYYPNTLLQTSI